MSSHTHAYTHIHTLTQTLSLKQNRPAAHFLSLSGVCVTGRLAVQRQRLAPCEGTIEALSTPSVDHSAKQISLFLTPHTNVILTVSLLAEMLGVEIKTHEKYLIHKEP